MKSSSVANHATNRCMPTTQPSLWDTSEEWPVAFPLLDPSFSVVRTIRFPGTPLAEIAGQRQYLLCPPYFHRGRMVNFYADVMDAWVENGVVHGRCRLTIGGRYVDELRTGRVSEKEDEEL